MDKTNLKPAIVPTAYSARVALGAFVLLALFCAFLWLYNAFGALQKARGRLAEPAPTRVEMPLYTVTLPVGWAFYSVKEESVTVFKNVVDAAPVLHIDALRDPGFAYHALDENPTVILRTLDEDITSEHLKGIVGDMVLSAIGTEILTVKPGISAVRILFDAGAHNGEGLVFYAGDVCYLIWALQADDDKEASAETREFFRGLFENMVLPDLREQIDRPVVHSGRLTAELNEATQLKIGREMALWDLFAARVEAEPESALLPALRHYREALTLMSSIRQERVALGSEAFVRYKALLDKRNRDVAEWFVVLDKAVAMRDWQKARRQAKWIMKHATLTGERLDARRAADILATKIPAEDAE